MAQLNLCEPAMDPSPVCLCTRLDFMDTYSFRRRFGNSTFAGDSYEVTSPSFDTNYNCATEESLDCPNNSTGFAVFNMKYIVSFPNRVPGVVCRVGIRMFDMESSLVKSFQDIGGLPNEDLHLTEVGCILYENKGVSSSFPYSVSTSIPSYTVTLPTQVPSTCTCSLPPVIMNQSTFDNRFAWQFPKTRFAFGTPSFIYTEGCQSVSMVCSFPVTKYLLNEKQSQKAMMFFNDEYMISGNDIRDVASRFNLHCDNTDNLWKFDEESENKFKNLLGVQLLKLSALGCATITEKK